MTQLPMPDTSPFRKSDRPDAIARPATKEEIGKQLDEFTAANGLKSLRDRLRIGLNEVGALAYEQTRKMMQEVCRRMANDDREAEMIFQNLQSMCVDIQQNGPWEYAKDLAKADSPEIKAWYILNGATSIGYEREMDLNDLELQEQIRLIQVNLDKAVGDPEKFFLESKEHALEMAAEAVQFLKRKDEKGRDIDEPEDKMVLRGEGLGTFLPMALMGREVGVAQDAEGWVYVGARGMISDRLIESCGLTRKMVKDPRDPKRQVTMFVNPQGQEVVKKVHRGLLVILSRNLELARSIAAAFQDEREAIEVADSATKHTRVVQTTEKAFIKDEEADREHWERKQFLRVPKVKGLNQETAVTTALSSPREEFYEKMLYIRAQYVYLDAMEKLRRERAQEGKEVTEHDREITSEEVWSKMKQKVEELRYVNGIVDELLPKMPEDIHAVIDMAGGAGDLGLAVSSQLLARGKKIKDVEIVDPQEGVDEFMHNIIDHLPFRNELEGVTHHNTGYLQDAHIRPDAIVVAKHACGTLTDDIIRQWIDSESPMLIAMTCCQDKAKHQSASYGMSQDHWHDTCVASALTNTEVPEQPGKARDIAIRKLEEGQRAMLELDMARVEYLRRHGFKAELRLNPEFPKGDVIIARRLPKNFMGKLEEFKALEKDEPEKFDAVMMQLDKLSRGGDYRGKRAADFGEGWIDDDFSELAERLSPHIEEKRKAAAEKLARQATENYLAKVEAKKQAKIEVQKMAEKKAAKEKMDALVKQVFSDAGGRQNTYVTHRAKETGRPIPKERIGVVMGIINTIIQESASEDPREIRQAIDGKMEELGF
ncbi:MAG: methyltransferase [Patescibacteria group bacterium]